jgi:hypothetical protein
MELPTHQKAIWRDAPEPNAKVSTYLRNDVAIQVPGDGELLVE